jgi:hypothetical protein
MTPILCTRLSGVRGTLTDKLEAAGVSLRAQVPRPRAILSGLKPPKEGSSGSASVGGPTPSPIDSRTTVAAMRAGDGSDALSADSAPVAPMACAPAGVHVLFIIA